MKTAFATGLLLHNGTNTTDRSNDDDDTDSMLRQTMFSAMSSDLASERMIFMGFDDDETFIGYFKNNTYDVPTGYSVHAYTYGGLSL